MAKTGIAFASGFGRGMASVTDMWLRNRFAREQQERDAQIQREHQERSFEHARQFSGEQFEREQSAVEAERLRGELEQYGMPLGAMAPLGPGEQGPTPATTGDLATSIKGAPAFLRAQADQKMQTDEAIRLAQARESAEQASQNVMTLADRLRLGSDIARIRGDALDAAADALALGAPGSEEIVARYGGDRQRAFAELANAYAKPAIDQLMALVPPDMRAGMDGLGGQQLQPTQSERIQQFEADLASETDPVKMRARYEGLKAVLRDMGQPLTTDQEALYEARLAEHGRQNPAMGVDPFRFGGAELKTFPATPLAKSATKLLLGRMKQGAQAVGGAVAGTVGGVREAGRMVQTERAKRGPAMPQGRTTAAKKPEQEKLPRPTDLRVETLRQDERRLIEQARQDMAMAGAVRRGITWRLERVQEELRRLGQEPTPLEAEPTPTGAAGN